MDVAMMPGADMDEIRECVRATLPSKLTVMRMSGPMASAPQEVQLAPPSRALFQRVYDVGCGGVGPAAQRGAALEKRSTHS